MHKAKIQEISDALQSSDRLIIVGGPTGAGKSTVIRLILEKIGKRIIEWHAPETLVGGTSLIDSFGDFLVGAALHGPSAVVLVDELPNILHDTTLHEFTKAIEYYISARDVPQLVFAFTETETGANYRDHIVVSRVFAPFLDRPKVRHIKVNTVNATLIKKTLNSVTVAELGAKSPHTNKAVQALASTGDIRSALLQYEFWLKGNPTLPPISRDSTAGFFHSIGKIIYGTQQEGGIDAVVDAHSDDLTSFNLTLLESYTAAHHQRLSLGTAILCCEWQSIADLGDQMRPLAIYGVANEIAMSEPDPRLPKAFRPLSFTPIQKSVSARAQKHMRITNYLLRQRRQGDCLSFYDGLVQEGYHLSETRNLQLDWDESESESDSDW